MSSLTVRMKRTTTIAGVTVTPGDRVTVPLKLAKHLLSTRRAEHCLSDWKSKPYCALPVQVYDFTQP